MPDFTYKAIDKFGKEKRGNITMDSLEAAYDHIRSEDMIPVEVKKATILTKEMNLNIGKAVKPRDLSVFCRQFISMITAGVTIIDALDMLQDQTENKALAHAIGGVRIEIGKGETLATGMEKYPKIFPDIMVQMIRAGEASGKLEVAMDRMGAHFEKSARLQAIMKKAAIYPIIVALVAVGVIAVMLIVVVPKYTEMFETLDIELPWITRAVVGASNFMIHKWYILVAVIAAIVVAVRAFKQTPKGQEFFGKLARTAPIFGKLTIKTAASNFARTLSTLIYSGLSMTEALEIVSGTMKNYLYKKKVDQIRDDVTRGIPLSEPLLEDNLFPSMVGHMTKIGEETGEVESMLNKLADYYDEEVEVATQAVLAAVEPLIILVLAAAVIVLIAAVMAPMLAMYNGLDNL